MKMNNGRVQVIKILVWITNRFVVKYWKYRIVRYKVQIEKKMYVWKDKSPIYIFVLTGI